MNRVSGWVSLGCLFMFCAAVQAADPTPLNGEAAMSLTPSVTKGPYYDQSTSERATRKLVRGIANVTLCVAEIPNQMFQEAYRTSPITGSVVGAWNGLVKGSQRLVIGLWEVATFYHPGRNNYQPYIDPEIVFMEYLH